MRARIGMSPILSSQHGSATARLSSIARHLSTSPSSSPSQSSPASAPPSSKRPHDLSFMKKRPAKVIPDYLNPMPSHLLTVTLSDLLQTSLPSTPIIAPSNAPYLPAGHHLVYFPIQLPPSALHPDGADLDHAPGEPYVRRMWAGGSVRFWGRVRMDGTPWVCREEIEEATVKGGEGREKAFVDVWRRYGRGHNGDKQRPWSIEERRTLVFMPLSKEESNASPSRVIKRPHEPSYSVTFTPTIKHLFHFSALTYNAHAIHLDPEHTRKHEGHRALLVHGPLTLSLMLRVVESQIPEGAAIRQISYRNFAPLYVGEEMTICVRRLERRDAHGEREEKWVVWAENSEGGLSVKGTVDVDLDGVGEGESQGPSLSDAM